MILDKQLIFSAAQAVTATADSTNVIDLGSFGDADGGKDLNLVVSTGTAGASAGGTAITTVTLQTSSDNGVSDAYVTIFSSPGYTVAQLAANRNLIQIMLPRGKERYLKLVYTVTVQNLTAGTINAELVFDVDTASNSQYKA